jgi:hypothetical protein
LWYSPLLPNWGSHLGFWFKYFLLFSNIFKTAKYAEKNLRDTLVEQSPNYRRMYIRQPTGRSNPGEQYCRSS